MDLKFSFIIPVYNRPEEIKELLESFAVMNYNESYEIVIVEDGSSIPSDEIVALFKDKLTISYYKKENTGPGASRNYGMERAKGNYFIILDSDCLLPPTYLNSANKFLNASYVDCYGGADAAHSSFSKLQKAINYTMTSFFTTGGIRGSKKTIQKFEPRSFNMGLSKEVFKKTNGYGRIHPGEDPDLSQRILKLGFTTAFLPEAFVYHKRRISWSKFYTQVKKFGLVRPILNKWHPEASKITFWLPTLFVCFILATFIAGLVATFYALFPLMGYILLVFVDASVKNKSILVGSLAVIAVFVQFFGYGLAFFRSNLAINWLGKNPEKTFPALFFKPKK